MATSLSRDAMEALTSRLAAVRGGGTSCVSLAVRAGADITAVRRRVSRESAVATNIRDRV